MTSLAIDYRYLYPHASAVNADEDNTQLSLATFTDENTNPHFFEGKLLSPFLTARLLQDLSSYVRTRFFMQINPLLLDPVVTSHGDFIRFEAFSGCCSAYVRLDLPPQSLEGETTGRGTTNVDFNPPMLAALGRVNRNDSLNLSVGTDQIKLTRNADSIVEKKVKLPLRWLRGFAAVTNYARKLTPSIKVDSIQASRFLKSLPRSVDNKMRWWIHPAGKSIRLSTRESKNAVQVGGLNRLRILENNISQCKTLTIYGNDEIDASGWELDFGSMRFSLIITHDVWRGFSGEGQGLFEIASVPEASILKSCQASLHWQSVLDIADIQQGKEGAEAVEQCVDHLASLGKVGFDMHANRFYHRQLPFELDYVGRLQPRLKDARKIVAAGGVQAVARRSNSAVTAYTVRSKDVTHSVELHETDYKCTCPWYAKHETRRGPCKHVLAAYISLKSSLDG